MARYTVQASAHIDAPADRIYGIIADYHVGHPGILPKAGANGGTDVTFFSELTSRDGLAGVIERFVSTRFLKKLYAEELALLASRSANL